MTAAFLLGLLLIASGAAAGGDDWAREELPHLQLPGIPDVGRGHGSDAPTPQEQLMDIMSTSGCGSFAALVAATPNATDVFQQRLVAGGGGLTVFCPDDKAVAAFEPTLRALADSDRVAILLQHGAAGRYVRARFAGFEWAAVPSLAVADAVTNETRTVLVRNRGDDMRLGLGPTWPRDCLGLAKVTSTVSSEESSLVLYVVDAVLLRQKLDGGEEAPARGEDDGWGFLQLCIPVLVLACACNHFGVLAF